MSTIPLHSSSEWQGSNAFHRSDPSYDVVGCQNVEGSGFEAAQRYEPTRPDYIVSSPTIPEFTLPYDYYDDSIPPSQHFPPIDRDFDINYPENYAMSTDSIGEHNSQVYYPLGQADVHAQIYTPGQNPPHEEHTYHPDLDSTPTNSGWIESHRDELLYHAVRDPSAPSDGLSAYQYEAAMRPVYSPAGPSGRSGSSQVEMNDLVQVDNYQTRTIDIKGRNVKQRQCSTCQKWFEAKPSNLQRHMDTHSGTTRYKCKMCKKEWVTKDQVIVHYMKYHMKVKPGRLRKDERKEAKDYVERV
ncbi:hypothetical protein RSOLAG22IIIB_09060 [Rhizoctonia solani]|uniref:C2H2-type domain-containing protein n=1 Tax=Rhizoctonia solani TaxID=456999 RepID=A0A0K6FXK8_9AGAM|nr:hypothetical protein RSOLAG22IIIB_09060 [Rhizoctonia solani]